MIYEYGCETDGLFEIICSVKEHRNPYECPLCGQPAEQVFSNVFMQPDNMWHGEYSANLKRYFTSKSQKAQYLKQNSLQIAEPGWKEQMAEERKQKAANREKEIEKDLGKIMETL